jgi:hypothetical protein
LLVFQETPGAGVYTARCGIPKGGIVTECFLVPLAAPWDATTALIDVGDVLNGATAYYSAVDLVNTLTAAYDPTSPASGTNYQNLPTGGNDYSSLGADVPGVIYQAADLITAVVTTTGAGGTTGLLIVQLVGIGLPSSAHHAVKV